MRTLIASLILLAAAPCSHAASRNQTVTNEAKQFLIPCPDEVGDKREYCLFVHRQFIFNYINSMAGDFEAERQIAYSLQHGGDGFISITLDQACAWQLVLTHSGNSRITRSELVVAGEVCGELDEVGRTVAATRAARIDHDIHTAPTRKVPDPDY